MKTFRNALLALLVGLTVFPNTLDAGVRAWVQSVPDRIVLAPKNSRVEFLRFVITSDVTEVVSDVLISANTDNISHLLRRIAILNNYGDEVGSIDLYRNEQRALKLSLRDTVVKAGWQEVFTLVGDTQSDLSGNSGQGVSLDVVGVGTRTRLNSILAAGDYPFKGARYVLNDSLVIGSLGQPERLYRHANVEVGNNQVIGAFDIPVGSQEDLSVRSLPFTIHTSGNAQAVTAVTLIDERGRVIAGPVDSTYAPEWGKAIFRFNEQITLQKGGVKVYFKANVGRDYANGGTITVSLNPADWIEVRGTSYGYEIPTDTLTTTTGPTMYTKGPRLDMSIQADPYVTIAAGSAINVLTVTLDATQSSEDMRIYSIPLTMATLLPYWATWISFEPYDLASGEAYLGGKTVGITETDSNSKMFPVLIPLSKNGNPLVVPRGTKKQIGIRALPRGGPAVYALGITDIYGQQVNGTKTGIAVWPNWTMGWTIIQVNPVPNGKG